MIKYYTTLRFIPLLAILVYCSSPQNQTISTIEAVLSSNYPLEQYELLELSFADTLLTADFIGQLSEQAQSWKSTHQKVNDQRFKEAMEFYGAEHVKHLHEQKLVIEDYMDSLGLIQDHLMSFSNQDEFDAEYLKEYYSLHHTLEALESESGETLWWVIQHQFQIGPEDTKEIKSEKICYFPKDSVIMPFDSSLDALMIYNIYLFRLSENL